MRLDDVAMTLQEAGMLRLRQGVEVAPTLVEGEGGGGGRRVEEGTSIVVTREMVEKVSPPVKRAFFLHLSGNRVAGLTRSVV